MTNNDNGGSTPSDPKIIPINRPKLVSAGGNPIKQPTGPQPAVEGPETFVYEIALNDEAGTTFQEQGFLVATPSFIGIGVGEGQLEALVPMHALLYVRKATEASAVEV